MKIKNGYKYLGLASCSTDYLLSEIDILMREELTEENKEYIKLIVKILIERVQNDKGRNFSRNDKR